MIRSLNNSHSPANYPFTKTKSEENLLPNLECSMSWDNSYTDLDQANILSQNLLPSQIAPLKRCLEGENSDDIKLCPKKIKPAAAVSRKIQTSATRRFNCESATPVNMKPPLYEILPDFLNPLPQKSVQNETTSVQMLTINLL